MVDVIAKQSSYIEPCLVGTMHSDLTNSRTSTSKMLPAIMQMFQQYHKHISIACLEGGVNEEI